ncbi:Mitochondrial matrix iron chaperone [Coemansia sp. RSA 2559]|nr:Mitochondrial matrix iron chaperone [Coemansia sp. RSA 2559]
MNTIHLSKRLFLCTTNTAASVSIRSRNSTIAAAWPAAIRIPNSRRTFGTSIQPAAIDKDVLFGNHKRAPVSKVAPVKKVVSDSNKHPPASKGDLIPLTDMEYEALASDTLDDLAICFDDIGEELSIDDFDVEYASGVLTVKLGEHGTYVLNKQPPNKQIWLSSPISGPERFDYDKMHMSWFCRHKNETLGTLLNREISQIFKGEFIMPVK